MAEKAEIHAKAQDPRQKCSNTCKRNSGYNSSGSLEDRVLQLQRTAGNQAVQKLVKSGTLQAKLRVGQPNDIYEQEADRVAEQVMSMPLHKVRKGIVISRRTNQEFIHGWFTKKVPYENRGYDHGIKQMYIIVKQVGTNHEDLTAEALKGTKYGQGAKDIIIKWSAELDEWKGPKLQQLGEKYKVLEKIGPTKPKPPETKSKAEKILHAFGEIKPEQVGYARRGSKSRLTGKGAIGTLFDEAIRNFDNGYLERGLTLLGISLHTVQDYYAHNVRLPYGNKDLRDFSKKPWVLEDDPDVDSRQRWREALERTREIITNFYNKVEKNERLLLDRGQLKYIPKKR